MGGGRTPGEEADQMRVSSSVRGMRLPASPALLEHSPRWIPHVPWGNQTASKDERLSSSNTRRTQAPQRLGGAGRAQRVNEVKPGLPRDPSPPSLSLFRSLSQVPPNLALLFLNVGTKSQPPQLRGLRASLLVSRGTVTWSRCILILRAWGGSVRQSKESPGPREKGLGTWDPGWKPVFP